MEKIIIWTDGSSRGNPGDGGFGAILDFGNDILEVGGFEENTTNNRMEIKASIEALKKIKNSVEVFIYSDSSYLVSAMTSWIHSWKKNNWKRKNSSGQYEDILNKDLFIELSDLVQDKKVSWIKVSGHSNIPANERCDFIATNFALKNKIDLYSGSKSGYKIDLSIKEGILKNRNKQKAYSYISLVNGQIFVDKSWDDCKKRVSSVSFAKYKKSISSEDELKIIEEFQKIKH